MTRATEYVQRVDLTPIQMTPNRKLALVMGRFTAEDAARSLQNSRCNAKPTAEFDASWGNGFIKPDFFVMVRLLRDHLEKERLRTKSGTAPKVVIDTGPLRA